MRDTQRAEQEDLLAEVAELYYEQDWTQARLARHMGLSQSQISRMVKEARERGIVEIRVHRPHRSQPTLQARLVDLLRLKDCRVLAAGRIDDRTDTARSTPARVGALAARYLQENLDDRQSLGLGWGRMVHFTLASDYLIGKREMTVIQIQGGMGGDQEELDGARLVSALGQRLEARTCYLNAPMVVTDASVRTGLLRDPHIRQTLEAGRRAEAVCMGIGVISEDSGLYRAGYLSDADLAYIAGAGAVGDVCGRYFRADGSPCELDLDERIIALEREALLDVPLRVGVSAGTAKAAANIGAARSGMVNVLITDELAATEMLRLLDDERGDGARDARDVG
jgi:DNA-binding transcriptional regulator LsrR (DeoR family)